MHLTLEQAAEELDIPDEAFQLVVKLGWMRYAITRQYYDNLYLLDEDQITVEHLDGLPISKDSVYYTPQDSPDYLYENHGPVTLLSQTAILDQTPPLITDLLEDFDGTFLRLATKKMQFHPIVLPISPNGLLADPLFSLEEITRFKASQRYSLTTFKSRGELKMMRDPFQPPMRKDDICEIMVESGNLFFREHKEIPSPLKLRKFMVSSSKVTYEVVDKPDGRNKHIKIEGEPISYDSFNKRFQQYLGG